MHSYDNERKGSECIRRWGVRERRRKIGGGWERERDWGRVGERERERERL